MLQKCVNIKYSKAKKRSLCQLLHSITFTTHKFDHKILVAIKTTCSLHTAADFLLYRDKHAASLNNMPHYCSNTGLIHDAGSA